MRDLVGLTCSWEIPPDSTAQGPLLAALAPPPIVREGRIATRRLPQPLFFSQDSTAQLFVPLLDPDQVVELVLVIFGDWNDIDTILGTRPTPAVASGTGGGSVGGGRALLAEIRARWAKLDGFDALIGTSAAIRLAMQRAQTAVRIDCPVAVCGPSGVGKVEVLQAIWHHRRETFGGSSVDGQFFPIDCRLVDSESLGGMLESFEARLQEADQAGLHVLCLESVDALDTAAVMLLLERTERMGDRFRLFAASNLPATELTSRGPAWHNLWVAAASLEIEIPGLAARREDIAPLCEHLVARACRRADRTILRLAEDSLALLHAYPWPGNLGELREAIESAVEQAVLTRRLDPSHWPVAIRTFPGALRHRRRQPVRPIDLDQVLREVEKTMVQRALELSPRNRAQAARLLSISRPRLLRLIELHRLGDSPTASSTDPPAGEGTE